MWCTWSVGSINLFWQRSITFQLFSAVTRLLSPRAVVLADKCVWEGSLRAGSCRALWAVSTYPLFPTLRWSRAQETCGTWTCLLRMWLVQQCPTTAERVFDFDQPNCCASRKFGMLCVEELWPWTSSKSSVVQLLDFFWGFFKSNSSCIPLHGMDGPTMDLVTEVRDVRDFEPPWADGRISDSIGRVSGVVEICRNTGWWNVPNTQSTSQGIFTQIRSSATSYNHQWWCLKTQEHSPNRRFWRPWFRALKHWRLGAKGASEGRRKDALFFWQFWWS